jgi:hypothetical protein
MKNTIANIRILDVVRLVHGYFIFVFLLTCFVDVLKVEKDTMGKKKLVNEFF